MRGALTGIRILDFSQMMLGPYGTQLLGDFGADVIKIERPKTGEWERGLDVMGELLGGDSPFFLAMNRNKKSVTLNLKDPAGLEIAYKLAKTADVVVHNFRPGVMERLGLGYEKLAEIKPDIIYCSGSGYGESGPYVNRPGQDLLIQGLSGIAANGGRAVDPPTPAGTPIADASTALLLAFSISTALVHRLRTGEGQKIEVSLFNTALSIQCQELVAYMNMEKRWERSKAGIAQAWLAAPYGVYETQDGYMAIAMNPLSLLADLMDLPQLKEYDDPELAYARRDEIKPIIEARTREKTTAEWLEILAQGDVWCGPVQGFDALVDDPQVRENEMIVEVDHPKAGRLKLVGVPAKFSKTPGSIRLAPPLVGEHTDEILGEIGYSSEQIEELRRAGVV